jgi:hypothetical protein
MAYAQKPDFVFRRNGRVYLNRQGRQFSRLLAAEVCASAVVMLDTPSFKVVWRVLATHSIRTFPLHFPTGASPCAITFQLDSTRDCFVATDHTDIRNIWRFISCPNIDLGDQLPAGCHRGSQFSLCGIFGGLSSWWTDFSLLISVLHCQHPSTSVPHSFVYLSRMLYEVYLSNWQHC